MSRLWHRAYIAALFFTPCAAFADALGGFAHGQ